jgi:futalosine hydrolase
MYLLTAATEFEMQAYVRAGGDVDNTIQLVTGFGLVEATLSLACLLKEKAGQVNGVLNFGIGGAYPENGTATTARLLDICVARQEILGDLGICLQDGFERFADKALMVENSFIPDRGLLAVGRKALDQKKIACKEGTFVTVNCASGTMARGRLLGREFQALCENMEGAAAARVCRQFSLPFFEVRCISNMVEDRNTATWKLQQACALAGQAAEVIVSSLLKKDA